MPPAEIAQQFEQALLEDDLDTAAKLAQQVSVNDSEWSSFRLKLGEAETIAQHYETAISWYRSILEEKPTDKQVNRAIFYIAELEREQGRLSEAESHYNTVLSAVGEDVATRERLAFLLTSTGRTWEAIPHFMAIAKAGSASYTDLSFLADLERSIDQQSFLRQCQTKAENDPAVKLGLAAHLFWQGNLSEAEQAIREIIKSHPEYLAGHAMLGELLALRTDLEFIQWYEDLPANATSHPRIWYSCGLWARRHQAHEAAARCFWEALRREPTSRRATTQLAQVLLALNTPFYQEFQARSSQLSQLTKLTDGVLSTQATQEAPIRELSQILEQSGRIWEACAWAKLALNQFPDAEWPRVLFQRQSPHLTAELPQVVATEDLSLKYDLSGYPPFKSLMNDVRHQAAPLPKTESPSEISFFEEEGVLSFRYFSSPDPATPGARIFEQNGGGACVLDYEQDGRPDLFFPQGKEWATGKSHPENSPQYRDSLQRQSPEGQYQEITNLALPADHGYGQGAAIGDFDNDGFPDIYVANVGKNQLLQNLGDGTFEDVTDLAGLGPEDWTASTLIVDFNGDGFPDLFDVNYVSGSHVYEMICKGEACSPKAFDGTPSRLHLNQQDGAFRTVPLGLNIRAGKGLGAVCLPLTSARYPSLFISNDQVANQLLWNRSESHPSEIEFIDEAALRGTAYCGDGVAMAGMGVAAEDADGNGMTDLFVTNFQGEPNTLYLQDSPGMFVDSTNSYGLKLAGLDFVGWGTQFLDADRDSLPDLVVANGHVDEYLDDKRPFKMRPQFFHQKSGRRFEELRGSQIGEYFDRPRRGRGLARLDWNLDGLMDFVVSQIDDQASLVTNRTGRSGHYVNLRLIATTTARDAIGTQVTLTAADHGKWTKFLLAGDGYMASNERVLQFGVGTRDKILEIQIEWPSGAVSQLASPVVDTTYLIVEGQTTAWTPSNSKASRALIELTHPSLE